MYNIYTYFNYLFLAVCTYKTHTHKLHMNAIFFPIYLKSFQFSQWLAGDVRWWSTIHYETLWIPSDVERPSWGMK